MKVKSSMVIAAKRRLRLCVGTSPMKPAVTGTGAPITIPRHAIGLSLQSFPIIGADTTSEMIEN